MTAMTRTRSLDWLRVGAWSGSFAAHISILLMVALPMTVPAIPEHATTIVARWIEPEIPPPTFREPPPPQAPHRVQRTPVYTPPPTVSASSDASTPATPIDDPVTPPGPAGIAPPSANDIGSGGAQTLAYASLLRPRYPPGSMRAREQGIVMLRVLVDETGVPQRVEIARSSGHALLDAAAQESVRHARFRPVMRDGRPASAWGTVPIEFRLDRG